MIKYRISAENAAGTWYYTGRKDRFRPDENNVNYVKFCYANGWSLKEETAKLYPELQKKAARDMAKYHKACLETISIEPEILDVEDYS